MSVVTGINTVFEQDGKQFHLQAEDLGSEAAAFEVRVYDKGSVLWLKRVSYGDLEEQGLPKLERDQLLRTKMEKTLLTVKAAIAKGKLG